MHWNLENWYIYKKCSETEFEIYGYWHETALPSLIGGVFRLETPS